MAPENTTVPRKIKPSAERLIESDYAATDVKWLVLSHVPDLSDPLFRTVTGHLARCKTIDGARKRLKQERVPKSICEYSIYDVGAKVLTED